MEVINLNHRFLKDETFYIDLEFLEFHNEGISCGLATNQGTTRINTWDNGIDFRCWSHVGLISYGIGLIGKKLRFVMGAKNGYKMTVYNLTDNVIISDGWIMKSPFDFAESYFGVFGGMLVDGVVSCSKTILKVYGLGFWGGGPDANIQLHEYKPATGSNNNACLYDIIENKFYYNQGDGNIIAGND